MSISDMIVIDGNLYFNAALKTNLWFNGSDNQNSHTNVLPMTHESHESKDNNSDSTDNQQDQINTNESTEVIDIWNGYLKKEAKLSKTWKKRWFVLQSNGELLCFNNEKSKHLMDTFYCKFN
eukprot:863307_1